MDNTHGMDTCSHIRLSVIVPIYNAEQYLATCIESIIAAPSADMEVLLVNDGSTDSSAEICEKYARTDNRLHVYHKENGGVSSARNYGLKQARGEWVTFVDADDFPAMGMLVYSPQQESDLVCFNWQYTTGETENEQLEDTFFQGEAKRNFLNCHLVDFVFRTPWAKLFRRNIITGNNIRFDERFRLGEDTLFMLDYLSHCKTIETKNHVGYVYLRPSQSKYNLPLSYSINYMNVFMQKYKLVGADCKHLLFLLEYYYFKKVGDKSFRTKIEWEKSAGVSALRANCWKRYSVKQKIKIVFLRICRRFIYGEN